MRQTFPAVTGTVDHWLADEGWGVLRTPDNLSVFCHFSQVVGFGFRTLDAGQQVEFDYTTPGQDGCEASVATYARPLGPNAYVAAAELTLRFVTAPQRVIQLPGGETLTLTSVEDWGTLLIVNFVVTPGRSLKPGVGTRLGGEVLRAFSDGKRLKQSGGSGSGDGVDRMMHFRFKFALEGDERQVDLMGSWLAGLTVSVLLQR